MYTFKVGDLVARRNPENGLIFKTGIVLYAFEETFVVKWTSYNKDFFLEKEGNLFENLNNLYLLSLQSIKRREEDDFLCLLNSN